VYHIHLLRGDTLDCCHGNDCDGGYGHEEELGNKDVAALLVEQLAGVWARPTASTFMIEVILGKWEGIRVERDS